MKHERVCFTETSRSLLNCFVGFFFNLSPAIVIFDRGEVKLKDISNGKKETKKKRKKEKKKEEEKKKRKKKRGGGGGGR